MAEIKFDNRQILPPENPHISYKSININPEGLIQLSQVTSQQPSPTEYIYPQKPQEIKLPAPDYGQITFEGRQIMPRVNPKQEHIIISHKYPKGVISLPSQPVPISYEIERQQNMISFIDSQINLINKQKIETIQKINKQIYSIKTSPYDTVIINGETLAKPEAVKLLEKEKINISDKFDKNIESLQNVKPKIQQNISDLQHISGAPLYEVPEEIKTKVEVPKYTQIVYSPTGEIKGFTVPVESIQKFEEGLSKLTVSKNPMKRYEERWKKMAEQFPKMNILQKGRYIGESIITASSRYNFMGLPALAAVLAGDRETAYRIQGRASYNIQYTKEHPLEGEKVFGFVKIPRIATEVISSPYGVAASAAGITVGIDAALAAVAIRSAALSSYLSGMVVGGFAYQGTISLSKTVEQLKAGGEERYMGLGNVAALGVAIAGSSAASIRYSPQIKGLAKRKSIELAIKKNIREARTPELKQYWASRLVEFKAGIEGIKELYHVRPSNLPESMFAGRLPRDVPEILREPLQRIISKNSRVMRIGGSSVIHKTVPPEVRIKHITSPEFRGRYIGELQGAPGRDFDIEVYKWGRGISGALRTISAKTKAYTSAFRIKYHSYSLFTGEKLSQIARDLMWRGRSYSSDVYWKGILAKQMKISPENLPSGFAEFYYHKPYEHVSLGFMPPKPIKLASGEVISSPIEILIGKMKNVIALEKPHRLYKDFPDVILQMKSSLQSMKQQGYPISSISKVSTFMDMLMHPEVYTIISSSKIPKPVTFPLDIAHVIAGGGKVVRAPLAVWEGSPVLVKGNVAVPKSWISSQPSVYTIGSEYYVSTSSSFRIAPLYEYYHPEGASIEPYYADISNFSRDVYSLSNYIREYSIVPEVSYDKYFLKDFGKYIFEYSNTVKDLYKPQPYSVRYETPVSKPYIRKTTYQRLYPSQNIIYAPSQKGYIPSYYGYTIKSMPYLTDLQKPEVSLYKMYGISQKLPIYNFYPNVRRYVSNMIYTYKPRFAETSYMYTTYNSIAPKYPVTYTMKPRPYDSRYISDLYTINKQPYSPVPYIPTSYPVLYNPIPTPYRPSPVPYNPIPYEPIPKSYKPIPIEPIPTPYRPSPYHYKPPYIPYTFNRRIMGYRFKEKKRKKKPQRKKLYKYIPPRQRHFKIGEIMSIEQFKPKFYNDISNNILRGLKIWEGRLKG